MLNRIERAGLRVIRWFHNRKRLKTGRSLYAHNTEDNTWSCTCSTTGSRIWTEKMKDAEPMHPSEFGGYRRGKTVDPQKLLRMEGWTDVWLYTEHEWDAWLKDEILDAVFKDIE